MEQRRRSIHYSLKRRLKSSVDINTGETKNKAEQSDGSIQRFVWGRMGRLLDFIGDKCCDPEK